MTSGNEMPTDPHSAEDPIVAAATAWLVRQRDPAMDGEAWLEFSDWLGRDPRHAVTYDALVEADADLVALAAHGAFVVEVRERRWTRIYQLAGAIAAVIVVALLVAPMLRGPRFTDYATAAHERREIGIAPGITVAMNSGTRLAVSDARVPVVRLETGEAAFVIDRPEPSGLRVEVAGLTLVDKGTVFDVVCDVEGVRIAVARGGVTVNPDTRPIAIGAGETLVIPADGSARRDTADPADMLGWRTGRLAYAAAPASRVAADLARNLGTRIELAPALAARRFSGAIRIDGDAADVVAQAAALLGGRAVRTHEGWRIEPQ